MLMFVRLLLGVLLSISVAQAQINVVPVNSGTGNLVSLPIPGGSGLSVTVGTGTAALPLQEIKNNPNAVNITTGDDQLTNVPLGFDFPFYGRVFNNSWAMTNGLVTFQDPWQSGLGGACCEGVDLTTTRDPRYNYTIFGLHSDLYSPGADNQYYLRGNNEMTYGWYGVSQCCGPQGGNSFEIKINSSGLVDTRIAGAMVSGNRVTSGMAGNLANGEYFQAYHGSGLNITPGSANIFSWQALGGTGAVDMCTITPLSSPACPGYQAAYTTQQCTISALYDPSCPGYAAAFTTQQCAINPLFSPACPGYQAAYLEQQCSLNPLYSTSCSGYQQAYQNQQCSLNSLYSTNCPGYATAYLEQQCSLNPLYSTTCSGYAVAYHDQQCAINPLFASDCPGYAVAYKTQQCTASPLYATDCPGYEQAYLNAQCIKDSLFSNKCEGYATAYAIKNLVTFSDPTVSSSVNNALSETAATRANDPANTKVEVATVSTTINTDGSVSTGVSATGDTNVDKLITAKAATSDSSPAAAVQLAPPPPAPQQQMAQNEPKGGGNKQEDKRDDAQKGAGGSSPSQNAGSSTASSDKPAAPTARQALQERRQEAARAKAVESGKQLANEMGKAADMEAQKEIQNVVIQAMGFTPGFDAYGKTVIPDVVGYRPFTVYNNQKNIDNRANLRMFGGTDRLHNDMVNSQYNRKD